MEENPSMSGLVVGEIPEQRELPLNAKDLQAGSKIAGIVHQALQACPYSVAKRPGRAEGEDILVVKFLVSKVVDEALRDKKLRAALVEFGAVSVHFGPVKVMVGAE